mgnify:CR=1 FL=1
MKTIDLTNIGTKRQYKHGDMIARITGNNFGDQIITYEQYFTKKHLEYGEISGFDKIGYEMYHEGEHIQFNEMKYRASQYKK